MRRIQGIVGIVVVIVGLLFSLTASVDAQGNQTPKVTNKIAPLPRDLEIQLALSALPPHLRDKVTLYALNPDKGFVLARNGTNGFHALVARTVVDAMRDRGPLRNIGMTFSTRLHLMTRAPRSRCGSTVTSQRCRRRGLRLAK